MRLLSITNSTKAKLIVAVNTLLAVAIAFGLPLTHAREGAVLAAVNALLAVFVHSPRRTPPRPPAPGTRKRTRSR